MEAKNEVMEVLPQPINLRDAGAAIINLSMQNQVFEDRFVSIGEALAQITSGMKELQNSMKDSFSIVKVQLSMRRSRIHHQIQFLMI